MVTPNYFCCYFVTVILLQCFLMASGDPCEGGLSTPNGITTHRLRTTVLCRPSLGLGDLPDSASQVLEVKVCATIPGLAARAFICLFVFCAYETVHLQCMRKLDDNFQEFSHSTMGTLGIKLRLSGLVASSLTHEPIHQALCRQSS